MSGLIKLLFSLLRHTRAHPTRNYVCLWTHAHVHMNVCMYRSPMFFNICNLTMLTCPYRVRIIINFPKFFQMVMKSFFLGTILLQKPLKKNLTTTTYLTRQAQL